MLELQCCLDSIVSVCPSLVSLSVVLSAGGGWCVVSTWSCGCVEVEVSSLPLPSLLCTCTMGDGADDEESIVVRR